MKKISRRTALGIMASSIAMTAFILSGCCSIKHLFKIPCDPGDEWKKSGSPWWRRRKKEREAERKAQVAGGKRPDVKLPYPYLECDRIDGPHGSPGLQLRNNCHLNEWCDVFVMVSNKGNAPSWNCIVEVYETPFASYKLPYKSFTLNHRSIVTIMPGESKEVKLKFKPTRATDGGLAIRTYDPMCDPGLLTFQQYDRHDSGVSWQVFRN